MRAVDVISRNSQVRYGTFSIIDSSGVFPPREFLNTFLLGGSDPCDQDSTMKPWKPFELSVDEYEVVFGWWQSGHNASVVDSMECDSWGGWVAKLIHD